MKNFFSQQTLRPPLYLPFQNKKSRVLEINPRGILLSPLSVVLPSTSIFQSNEERRTNNEQRSGYEVWVCGCYHALQSIHTRF